MIIYKFTIVFVQFDIPSALGPGSVTAVGIVNSPSEPATSSSISGSSTRGPSSRMAESVELKLDLGHVS